jgi:hypothetical protein
METIFKQPLQHRTFHDLDWRRTFRLRRDRVVFDVNPRRSPFHLEAVLTGFPKIGADVCDPNQSSRALAGEIQPPRRGLCRPFLRTTTSARTEVLMARFDGRDFERGF